ncbi:MAG: HAMP domain-containing protein [Sphingomonadales bacterium]
MAAPRQSPHRRPWLARRARLFNRRLAGWMGRSSLYPRLELLAVVLTITIGWSSYAFVTRRGLPANGASPSLVTALLVANLVPVMLLMVLIGRRIAILLANRRRGLAGAQLHVRLVALFAGIAAVPTLLVVIFASLLFQFGVQFWFSDRVKTILDSSNTVAQAYVEENRQRVAQDITAMATDLNGYALEFGESSPMYAKGLDYQLAARNLDEGAVFMRGRASQLTMVIGSKVTLPELVEHLRDIDLAGALIKPATLIGKGRDRIEAAVAMDPAGKRYLYISRKVDPAVLDRAARAAGALGEYNALAERSRIMQWRFNLVLMAVSLLTLAVAVWFALWLANRLVAPIAALAKAAEQVGQGDLNARVPVTAGRDEVTALSRAFNRMTAQLKSDQDELVAANRLSDARRQFIEAVLGGVSAGVMSITAAGSIRVANQSAALLLGMPAQDLAGRALVDVVPELADLLDQVRHDGQMSGQVSVARGRHADAGGAHRAGRQWRRRSPAAGLCADL